jgi:hypothetical protein
MHAYKASFLRAYKPNIPIPAVFRTDHCSKPDKQPDKLAGNLPQITAVVKHGPFRHQLQRIAVPNRTTWFVTRLLDQEVISAFP